MSAPRFDEGRLALFADRLAGDVEAGLIPGVDVLVGGRDGVLWRRCLGFRDTTARDPLREDAVWRIFSMTKPVTSVAYMMLLEAGVTSLNDPVSRVIPEFADLGVYSGGGGDAAGARTLVAQIVHRPCGGTRRHRDAS